MKKQKKTLFISRMSGIPFLVLFCAFFLTACGQSTPTSSSSVNHTSVPHQEPVFSQNGGFYEEELSLELIAGYEDKIYYTLDGSDPRTSSTATLYQNGIRLYDNTSDPNIYSAVGDITLNPYTPPNTPVEKGIVVRAVAKTTDGTACSEVVSNSYFIGKEASYYTDMKVISMITDGNYLFHPDTGVYMVGSAYYTWRNSNQSISYDPSDVLNPTNYNQNGIETEFPVTIQVFDQGTLSFTTNAGARISGNWSRSAPQKSLRLYARKEYGSSKLQYSFFEGLTDKNGNLIQAFDKVTLSNGGNDFQYLHFRDALIQELAKDLSIDTLASEPCILFLNGEFWGFYLIREKADGDYLESHYKIDKDSLTIIKNGEVDTGSNEDLDAFREFCHWALRADMTIDANYQTFCDTVDLQSFMDYMTVETYINNADWCIGYTNNWQTWRSKEIDPSIPQADGKWRFTLFDTDMSAGLYQKPETMAEYDSLSRNWAPSEDFYFSEILRNLINNKSFCQAFFKNYVRIIDTCFSPELVDEKITSYVTAYQIATCDTFSRFDLYWAAGNYEYEVNILRDFFQKRPSYAMQYLKDFCHIEDFLYDNTNSNSDDSK